VLPIHIYRGCGKRALPFGATIASDPCFCIQRRCVTIYLRIGNRNPGDLPDGNALIPLAFLTWPYWILLSAVSIVVVVLAGPHGEFSDLSSKGPVAALGDLVLQSEKYLVGLFSFVSKLALMTMIVSTILGTAPAVLFLARSRFVGRNRPAGFLSVALSYCPGVVVGLAPLLPFHSPRGLGTPAPSGAGIGQFFISTPYESALSALLSWRTFDVSLEKQRAPGSLAHAGLSQEYVSPTLRRASKAGHFAFIVRLWPVRSIAVPVCPNSEAAASRCIISLYAYKIRGLDASCRQAIFCHHVIAFEFC